MTSALKMIFTTWHESFGITMMPQLCLLPILLLFQNIGLFSTNLQIAEGDMNLSNSNGHTTVDAQHHAACMIAANRLEHNEFRCARCGPENFTKYARELITLPQKIDSDNYPEEGKERKVKKKSRGKGKRKAEKSKCLEEKRRKTRRTPGESHTSQKISLRCHRI